MRRGTTPIVTLTVEKNLDNYNTFVTIDQNGTQVTKASRTSDDVRITKHYDDDGNFLNSTIAVYLSQADTLLLDVGEARVQARFVNFLDEAEASSIGTIQIEEVLLDEVIQYGE